MVDNEPELPAYQDPPEVFCRHFLTCRRHWFDHNRPEDGIGFAGIYTHFEPPRGGSYPQVLKQIFVYFQLWGDSGEYVPRIRLVRIDSTEEDESVEEIREYPMPSSKPIEITGLNFVDECTFPIGPIPIRETGVYEFQLWLDGIDEPIGREQVLARESTQ